MGFEWDHAKNKANKRKHGISFEAVAAFEFESAWIFDDDFLLEEERSKAIGFIGDRVHHLVYTMRGGNVRVISLRRATNEEKRAYGEYIKGTW